MNRTFNHRVMALEWCAILLFIFGTLYGFWNRENVALVILGAMFLVLTTMALDRALHTSYIVSDEKLHIKRGRLTKEKCINIAEMISIRELPLAFRIGSYILLELKNGKVESVQPDNKEVFIATIQKQL